MMVDQGRIRWFDLSGREVFPDRIFAALKQKNKPDDVVMFQKLDMKFWRKKGKKEARGERDN